MSDYEFFDLHEFNRNEKWGQAKEEEVMDQPGKTDQQERTLIELPHAYNPYQSGIRIKPLLTEEDIVERAAYYDREWEARSGATKEGWRKVHSPAQRDLRVALKILGVILVGVLLAWASL